MKVLAPDYYSKFNCKCGKCRNCCCIGWGVTISYNEYCRLVGLDCARKLRNRLDCAFFILEDATQERYAKMKPNYLGECPLRDDDGLCMLQKECGEDVLPIICKMYPRNSYLNILQECACANSCEGVLDIIFSTTDKIKFVEIDNGLQDLKRVIIDNEVSILELQRNVLKMLEDRTHSLNERLIEMGEYIEILDNISKDKSNSNNILEDELPTVINLIEEIENYSPNFSKISIIADNDLGIVNETQTYDYKNIAKEYKNCLDLSIKKIPNLEIYFEKLLINHLFFERFPYSYDYDSIWHQYIELCGIYAISKFISVVYMKDKDSFDYFVDCISCIFRCFEHSNANEVVLATLKRLGKATHSHLMNLIRF